VGLSLRLESYLVPFYFRPWLGCQSVFTFWGSVLLFRWNLEADNAPFETNIYITNRFGFPPFESNWIHQQIPIGNQLLEYQRWNVSISRPLLPYENPPCRQPHPNYSFVFLEFLLLLPESSVSNYRQWSNEDYFKVPRHQQTHWSRLWNIYMRLRVFFA